MAGNLQLSVRTRVTCKKIQWRNFERQFSVAADNARGLLDAGVANDPRARLATGIDHHHL